MGDSDDRALMRGLSRWERDRRRLDDRSDKERARDETRSLRERAREAAKWAALHPLDDLEVCQLVSCLVCDGPTALKSTSRVSDSISCVRFCIHATGLKVARNLRRVKGFPSQTRRPRRLTLLPVISFLHVVL